MIKRLEKIVTHILALMILIPYAGVVLGDDDTDPGRLLYEQTLTVVEKSRTGGADLREISDIYLWGAGKCRDAGAGSYAIELFELAVQEDPSHVRAHRVYGDYLMGYRGLYEYARYHYDRAVELIKNDPDEYDDIVIDGLERSLQILHRDGKDGVPIVESKFFSAYVGGSIGYGKVAPNHVTVSAGDGSLNDMEGKVQRSLDFRTQELLDGQAFFGGVVDMQNEGLAFFGDQVQETIASDRRLDEFLAMGIPPNFPFFGFETDPATGLLIIDSNTGGPIPITINSRRAENAAYRAELQTKLDEIQADKAMTEERLANDAAELAGIPAKKKKVSRKVPRRRDDLNYDGTLTLRFGSPYLPYIRIFGERIDGENVDVDPEDLEDPLDRSFRRDGVLVGKNIMLTRTLDLNTELEYTETQLRFYRTVVPEGLDHKIADEESDQYRGETTLTYNMPFKTLKMKLGGTWSDIENLDSKDDFSRTHVGTVRFSKYLDPSKQKSSAPADDEQTARFRGRRSSHWEAGLIHSERKYRATDRPTVTEEVYRPFVSWEELGLFGGKIDLTMIYDWRHQEFSQERPTEIGGIFFENDDTVSGHQLTFIPAYVPVYKSYNNDFWSGLELLTISLPTSYAFDDGDYDRLLFGLRLAGRYVTRYGVAVMPALNGDYAYYPELDRDDWGFFLRLSLISGAWKKIKS